MLEFGQPHRVESLISAGLLEVGDGYRAKNDELSTSGLPFARGGNIDGGFHFDGADRFPLDSLQRVGPKVSKVGDVVFTSKGTVGRFAFVRPEIERFVYSPQLCYWRSLSPGCIHPRWLYYWMHSTEFQEQFKGVAGQTDMADYVSLRDQRRFWITVPQPQVQESVAEALGALDDKIELNRRMNQTLEAMARALFKSWFVDFEPVVAKSEGRPTGLPPDLDALFPSEFEDSTMGPVPKGWCVCTIGDLADVVGGSTPSTSQPEFWDGTHCWATPRDLSRLSNPVLLNTERRITDKGVACIGSGLLPVGTVLMSSRAPIGYFAVAQVPVAINQGFIAMKPKDGIPNLYLLNWVQANQEVILSRANGSTFLEISKSNFRPIEAVRPPQPLLDEFYHLTLPWFEKLVTNERETRALTAMRDDLVPRLLSGEVEVAEVEEMALG